MIQKKYEIKDSAYLTAYLHESDKSRPAIVVIPGGAYMLVGSNEGEPVAQAFYENGFQSFVFSYSTITSDLMKKHPDWTFDEAIDEGERLIYDSDHVSSNYPNSLVELAMAMKLITDHADEMHVDVSKIATIGFSAGGHLSAVYGNWWNEKWLLEKAGLSKGIQPWFQVICYGVTRFDEDYLMWLKENQPGLIKMYKAFYNTIDPDKEIMDEWSPVNTVNQNTPPTFIWHTAKDELVPIGQSLDYAKMLQEKHVPWEVHFYEQGSHALSLASERTGTNESHVQTWFDLLMEWVKYYRK